jgi:hypothetical protein
VEEDPFWKSGRRCMSEAKSDYLSPKRGPSVQGYTLLCSLRLIYITISPITHEVTPLFLEGRRMQITPRTCKIAAWNEAFPLLHAWRRIWLWHAYLEEEWLFAQAVTLLTFFLDVPEWNFGPNTDYACRTFRGFLSPPVRWRHIFVFRSRPLLSHSVQLNFNSTLHECTFSLRHWGHP